MSEMSNEIEDKCDYNDDKMKFENKNNQPRNSTDTKIVWRNVVIMSAIHLIGLYGFFSTKAKPQTIWWSWLIGQFGSIGILAGAHRLWSHRSYKAHWSLRLVLMISQTIALQNDIFEWCRDHRAHHKFSETNADPHNSRRGFFFSHMGWLLCRKHPDVKQKGSTIDMSDLLDDSIVRFQHRFYLPLVIIFWGIIPVWIPVHFWNENLFISFAMNLFRYVVSLHHTWLVNSAAHIYGYRYYDRKIRPRENKFVAYLTHGEGYHNYHHVFPFDYSASELSWNNCFNPTTAFIDLCAWLGLAYDRRTVTKSMLEDRIKRTGESYDAEHRKPRSVIIDIMIGITIAFWAVILQYAIRYITSMFVF